MEELKKQIIELCNDSGMPLEAIVFVLKDAWRDAQDSFEIYKKQLEKKKAEDAETTETKEE
jgi:hypothetical protein